MQGSAIVLMLISTLVIWGGLVASATALVVRGRREKREQHERAIRTVLHDAGLNQG
jgi:hypothetical protein